jgi:hypothetical protein
VEQKPPLLEQSKSQQVTGSQQILEEGEDECEFSQNPSSEELPMSNRSYLLCVEPESSHPFAINMGTGSAYPIIINDK